MTPQDLAKVHAAAMSGDRPWSAAEFAQLLESPGAILSGDVRSFVLGRVTLDEAEVLTVATQPEFRRQGLAQAALAQFETTAQKCGALQAFLEVAATNDAAKALYSKCNYAQVGLRKNYYTGANGAAIDALVLCKSFT